MPCTTLDDPMNPYCTIDYEYSTQEIIYSFMTHVAYLFFGFFLLFNGTLLSTLIISYCSNVVSETTNYEVESSDKDECDDDDDNRFYEYKYIDEFENMINIIEDEDTNYKAFSEADKLNLSNLVLMETTPNGNVVMSYEYDKDVPERSKFIYYTNDKSIPYKYLDAVARKYVYVYKCPEIYVYIKNELTKELNRISEEKKQEETKQMEEKKKNSVFASFKNYKNPTVKKQHILVTKNKYKYLGTIEDYNKSLLPKEERKEVKPISFSQFKQMNMPS